MRCLVDRHLGWLFGGRLLEPEKMPTDFRLIPRARQRNDTAMTGVIDLTVEHHETAGFKRLDGAGRSVRALLCR